MMKIQMILFQDCEVSLKLWLIEINCSIKSITQLQKKIVFNFQIKLDVNDSKFQYFLSDCQKDNNFINQSRACYKKFFYYSLIYALIIHLLLANRIMSLRLKVSFRGKNIVLGGHIKSFDDIRTELEERFNCKKSQNVEFRYKNVPLSEFEEIKEIAEAQNLQAVKLEAIVSQSGNSFISSCSRKSQSRNMSEGQLLLQSVQESVINANDIDESNFTQIYFSDAVQEHPQMLGVIIGEEQFSGSQFLVVDSEENRKSLEASQEKKEKPLLIQKNILEKEDEKDRPFFQCFRNIASGKAPKKKVKKIRKISKQELLQKEIEINSKPEENVLQPINKQQNEIYRCFYCKGQSKCHVCDNKGYFSQNSEFIKVVDQIVNKRIQEKLKQYVLVPKQQMREKLEVKKLTISDKQNIKLKESQDFVYSALDQLKIVMRESYSNKKSVIQGFQFVWDFVIECPKILKAKTGIYLMDAKTGNIQKLKVHDQNVLTVGPFIATSEGSYEKKYRLFYYNTDYQMKFFGDTFGFSVPVINPNKKFCKKVDLVKFIDKLLKETKINKNNEEIIEKLQILGINNQNYEGSIPLIEVIIRQI